MQCRNCGNTIKEGTLECQLCQMQVRMVPDYCPEDEVLIHQVRSAMEHNGEFTPTREQREQTGQLSSREVEMRRRKLAEKRRTEKKKQQVMAISLLVLIAVLVGGISYLVYVNSYTGITNKADKYRVERQYENAAKYYNKAIDKKSGLTDAYVALSEMYVYLEQYEDAEAVFLSAVESNDNSLDMYMLMINYYIDRKEFNKIMPFLNGYRKQSVMEDLSEYIVEQPEFSLDEATYDDVREVSLTSEEPKIYYTTEGRDATSGDSVYDGPVQISEGTTELSFIAENELGVTSIPLTKTYVVELPIEGAPIVSPSTGQYTSDTEIIVQVPVGYTAHYTTDGSVPDMNSTKYTEPVEMPSGNTIFSAVLIHASGRVSDVTKRNYELVID